LYGFFFFLCVINFFLKYCVFVLSPFGGPFPPPPPSEFRTNTSLCVSAIVSESVRKSKFTKSRTVYRPSCAVNGNDCRTLSRGIPLRYCSSLYHSIFISFSEEMCLCTAIILRRISRLIHFLAFRIQCFSFTCVLVEFKV